MRGGAAAARAPTRDMGGSAQRGAWLAARAYQSPWGADARKMLAAATSPGNGPLMGMSCEFPAVGRGRFGFRVVTGVLTRQLDLMESPFAGLGWRFSWLGPFSCRVVRIPGGRFGPGRARCRAVRRLIPCAA